MQEARLAYAETSVSAQITADRQDETCQTL